MGLSSLVVTCSFHASGAISNPGCSDGYALRMSSNKNETQRWCFPSARLTGRPTICPLIVKSKGQSVKVKNICIWLMKPAVTVSLVATEASLNYDKLCLRSLLVSILNPIERGKHSRLTNAPTCRHKKIQSLRRNMLCFVHKANLEKKIQNIMGFYTKVP